MCNTILFDTRVILRERVTTHIFICLAQDYVWSQVCDLLSLNVGVIITA